MHDTSRDALLARRAAAGDSVAFRALYERHARGIYLLAYRLLDREGASDVVQDVFMTVWSNGHQFDEQRGSFRTWLTAIAVLGLLYAPGLLLLWIVMFVFAVAAIPQALLASWFKERRQRRDR